MGFCKNPLASDLENGLEMGRSEVESTSNSEEVVLVQASDEERLDYGRRRAARRRSRGIWEDVLGGKNSQVLEMVCLCRERASIYSANN